MTQKQPPTESDSLITPGDMRLTVISRASLLMALKRKDKQLKRHRPKTELNVHAALHTAKVRRAIKRTRRIIPPSVGSVRRTKKIADILALHDAGKQMKAIVLTVGTTYAYADKILRENGRTPEYKNARPKVDKGKQHE